MGSGRPRATICLNGHPMTPENVAIHDGRRKCRICASARAAKYRQAAISRGTHTRKEWMASPPTVAHSYAWEVDLGVDVSGSVLLLAYPRMRCTCPEVFAATQSRVPCPACVAWDMAHPLNPSGSKVVRTTVERVMQEVIPPDEQLAVAKKRLELYRDEYWTKHSHLRHLADAIHALEARRVQLGGKPLQPTNLPERKRLGRPPLVIPHDTPRTLEDVAARLADKRLARHTLRGKMRYLRKHILAMEGQIAAMEGRKPRPGPAANPDDYALDVSEAADD